MEGLSEIELNILRTIKKEKGINRVKINQIARKAHTAGYAEVHSELMQSIAGLDNLIKRIEE